jgi:hypothetical protein
MFRPDLLAIFRESSMTYVEVRGCVIVPANRLLLELINRFFYQFALPELREEISISMLLNALPCNVICLHFIYYS